MYRCAQSIDSDERKLLDELATILTGLGDGMKANLCDKGWVTQRGSPAAEDEAFMVNLSRRSESQNATKTVSMVLRNLCHVLVDSTDSCAVLLESDKVGLAPLAIVRSGIETAGTLLWALDSAKLQPNFELKTVRLRYARCLTVELKNYRESNQNLPRLTGQENYWDSMITQIIEWGTAIGLQPNPPPGPTTMGFDEESYPRPSDLGAETISFSEEILKNSNPQMERGKAMYALQSTATHGLYYFYEELGRVGVSENGRNFEHEATERAVPVLTQFAFNLVSLTYWAFASVCTYLGWPFDWAGTLYQRLFEPDGLIEGSAQPRASLAG